MSLFRKISILFEKSYWGSEFFEKVSGIRSVVFSPVYSLILTAVFLLAFESIAAQNWNWTGDVSNDWHEAANWDQGSVPDGNAKVIIGLVSSGIYPEIKNNVTVSTLTVSDWYGGAIAVVNGATLTVENNLDIQDYGEILLDNGNLQFNGKGNNGHDITMAFLNTSIRIVNSGTLNSPNCKLTINGELILEDGNINLGDGFELASGKTFDVLRGSVNVYGPTLIKGTLNGGVGNFVFDGDSSNSTHKAEIRSEGRFYMSPSASDVQTLDCTSDTPELSGGTVDFYTPCYIQNSGYFYGGNAYVTFYNSISPNGTAVIETHNGILLFKADLTAHSTANINITCEGTIQVDGNTTLKSAGYINAMGGNIYFGGNLRTEKSSGTINAGGSTIYFSGSSFENEGYFNAGTSTFVFSGGSQEFSTHSWRADNTFYNLVVEIGADVQSTHNVMVLNDLEVSEAGSFTIEPGKTLDAVGYVTGEDYIFTNRPYIISIVINSENTITAVFNEPLDPVSSQTASNYRVENETGNTIDYPLNPVLGGVNNNEISLTLGFNIVSDVDYYLIGNNIKNLNNYTLSVNHKKRFLETEPANFWRWAGTIDSEWEKAGNWVKNKLPQTSSHVVIPITPNDPLISSQGNRIFDLEIKTGASLTIGSTGNLTVDNSVSNSAGSGGLLIASDTEGTGSLIHNTNGVLATFQRYISGEPQTWQMISSPVADQEISGNFTPTGGSDAYGDNTRYDFYSWYEPDTSWVYLLNIDQPPTWLTSNNNSNNFISGRGYLISYKDAHPTKAFQGTLSNGEVSVQLSKTAGTGTEFGFNLVGNPYPSSVDWKSSGWGRNTLEGNNQGYDIWIWSETNNNYGAYNSASASDDGTLGVSRYIAPTQGFFVKASQSGVLSMNNSVRVNKGAGNWLKSANSTQNRIVVDVESSDGFGKDEVIIEFGHTGQETGTAKRFSFVSASPSLFLEEEQMAYSIRLLGEKEDYPVLPVSFDAGESGNYELTFQFNSTAFEIFRLYDRITGQWNDIEEGEVYSFEAEKDENTDRFVLQIVSGDYADPYETLPVIIYSEQRKITADLRLVEGEYTCDVYTLTGQKLVTRKLFGGQTSQFVVPSASSIVIVQIVGQEGRKIEKVPVVY
ncbi:hypothetical protein GM418_20725 [Maribellus comscasis]|uniref:T9SS C-terminal target domain-containing protein n=1 Tax=Maribellus comscasis TaxID=2681766 RepID=A0A6I6JSL5_9BACT|nr:Ig-like domain-containing protein [Maribellus comscasis]QGY46006.1 hypothetical protein GM418_20725 [Maribellus comscasis]